MIITSKEIKKFCGVRGWLVFPTDREYQALTDEEVQDLYSGFIEFLALIGKLDYVAETNDCDDFAAQFWAYCRRTANYSRPPAVGFFITPGHAINVIFTPAGKKYFEPQSGKYVSKAPLSLLVV